MPLTHVTTDDAAMVLIDHQVGTIDWVRSTDVEGLTLRALSLARAATGLGMPLVLTSSLEDQAQGPLLPEFEQINPTAFAGRVQRVGVVDSMDDPAFAAAVAATGRRKLIMAGVTNDVCTVFAVLSALGQGYEVQVVADAGGSPTAQGDAIAVRRMERAGADIVGTSQLLAELAVNWGSPAGQVIVPITTALIPT